MESSQRALVRKEIGEALSRLRLAREHALKADMQDTARSLEYVIDWVSVTYRKAKNDRPAPLP